MYQITQLNKIYGENETANHVLKDFSLEIPDKQILCITGASGSGKTTLLKQLILAMTPDEQKSCIYIKATTENTIEELNADLKLADKLKYKV